MRLGYRGVTLIEQQTEPVSVTEDRGDDTVQPSISVVSMSLHVF